MIKLSTFFLLMSLLLPTSVFSHEKAHSFQTIVGENLVIINYSHDNFPLGIPITFDARLYTLKEGLEVDFANAKVIIKKGEEVVIDRPFQKIENEEIEFTQTFESGGDYTFYVSFFSHNQTHAEATFPFVVENPQTKATTTNWPLMAAGGVVIVGLAYLAGYRQTLKLPKIKLK
jgi:hypothetical protein